MKKMCFLLSVATLFAMTSCASMMGTSDRLAPGENQVQAVIEFPGMDRAAIFRASEEWMVRTFVSSKDVIQYENRDDGTIMGKANARMNVGGLGEAAIEFVISIEIKDGKARLTFKDFFFYEAARDPILGHDAGYPTKANLSHFQDFALDMQLNYERIVKSAGTGNW